MSCSCPHDDARWEHDAPDTGKEDHKAKQQKLNYVRQEEQTNNRCSCQQAKSTSEMRQNDSTSRREISISRHGNLWRVLLRLAALDQLIQTVGNVQTRSASSKESEPDQSDHGTHEFFGADSAWMLKHGDDDEDRDQSRTDAHDPNNYEDKFSDHEGPSQGGVNLGQLLLPGHFFPSELGVFGGFPVTFVNTTSSCFGQK
jgi:hypothetical protein